MVRAGQRPQRWLFRRESLVALLLGGLAMSALILAPGLGIRTAQSESARPYSSIGFSSSAEWGGGPRPDHAVPEVVGPNDRSLVIASVPVGTTPSAAAVDPQNGFVYVTNRDSDNVSVIDGTSVTATIVLGNLTSGAQAPWGIAYDPIDQSLYVANKNSGNVSVIRELSVVASVEVGQSPVAVACDSRNGLVYVTNTDSANVSVLNGTSAVASIPIPDHSSGATFDPANGYVYVTSSTSDSVSVIDGTSVIATIPVAPTPWGAAYDSANGDVYVANSVSQNVSVLSATSFVASVSAPGEPMEATYDSANGYVYVSEFDANDLAVINGTSVIATVPAGESPYGGAFDPSNGYLYITNQVSNNVSVINGSVFFPTISSVTASPASVSAGSTTTISVRAEAGEGLLTYAYVGLPPGCSSADTAALVCVPSLPGNYTVRVYANNSVGLSATASTSLTVTPRVTSPSALGQYLPLLAVAIASGAFMGGLLFAVIRSRRGRSRP